MVDQHGKRILIAVFATLVTAIICGLITKSYGGTAQQAVMVALITGNTTYWGVLNSD